MGKLTAQSKSTKTIRTSNPRLAKAIDKEAFKRGVSANTVIKEYLGAAFSEEEQESRIEKALKECRAVKMELQYLDVRTPFYFSEDEEKTPYKLLFFTPRGLGGSQAQFVCENLLSGMRVEFGYNDSFYKQVTLRK